MKNNRKLKNRELNRISIPEFKSTNKTPVIVLLDNIRSLNNIGSVFRTCDAFLIQSIYLCGITACPPHNEIHKTALGATDSIDWKYFENTLDSIETLRSEGFTILAVEQAKETVHLEKFNFDNEKKYAFIFGNEVKGVLQEAVNASDYCIEIPQMGTKHSFNISVSLGIVLWEYMRNRF